MTERLERSLGDSNTLQPENIIGSSLDEVLLRTKGDTFQSTAQIATVIMENKASSFGEYFVGEGVVFTVEDDEVFVYITPGYLNPLIKNPRDATKQTLEKGYYTLEREDFEEIRKGVESGDVLKINLLDLDLENYMPEYNYSRSKITFPISKHSQLEGSRRALTERLIGQGDEFSKIMEMIEGYEVSRGSLGEKGIIIRLFKPEFVKRIIESNAAQNTESEYEAIAGACVLEVKDNFPQELLDIHLCAKVGSQEYNQFDSYFVRGIPALSEQFDRKSYLEAFDNIVKNSGDAEEVLYQLSELTIEEVSPGYFERHTPTFNRLTIEKKADEVANSLVTIAKRYLDNIYLGNVVDFPSDEEKKESRWSANLRYARELDNYRICEEISEHFDVILKDPEKTFLSLTTQNKQRAGLVAQTLLKIGENYLSK